MSYRQTIEITDEDGHTTHRTISESSSSRLRFRVDAYIRNLDSDRFTVRRHRIEKSCPSCGRYETHDHAGCRNRLEAEMNAEERIASRRLDF